MLQQKTNKRAQILETLYLGSNTYMRYIQSRSLKIPVQAFTSNLVLFHSFFIYLPFFKEML